MMSRILVARLDKPKSQFQIDGTGTNVVDALQPAPSGLQSKDQRVGIDRNSKFHGLNIASADSVR